MIAWFSLPGSQATLDWNHIGPENYPKIAVRVILGIYIFCTFLPNLRSYNWSLSTPVIWLYVYLFWSGISVLYSSNTFFSLSRWIDTLLILLVTLHLCSRLINTNQVHYFCSRLFQIVIFILCLALAVFFLWPEWGSKFAGYDFTTYGVRHRLGGTFLRTDILAGLSLAALLYYTRDLFTNNRRTDKFSLVYVAIALLTMILAFSRASLLIALFLLFIDIWRVNRRPIVKIIYSFLIAISLFNIEIVFPWLMRHSRWDELSTLNNRIIIWKTLLSNYFDFCTALIGHGYLTNNSLQSLDFFVPSIGRSMNQPHNGYLSVLMGTGLIGLSLVIIITYMWFRLVNRIIKTSSSPTVEALHRANVGLILFSFVDFGIWGTPNPQTVLFFFSYILLNRLHWLNARAICNPKRPSTISHYG